VAPPHELHPSCFYAFEGSGPAGRDGPEGRAHILPQKQGGRGSRPGLRAQDPTLTSRNVGSAVSFRTRKHVTDRQGDRVPGSAVRGPAPMGGRMIVVTTLALADTDARRRFRIAERVFLGPRSRCFATRGGLDLKKRRRCGLPSSKAVAHHTAGHGVAYYAGTISRGGEEAGEVSADGTGRRARSLRRQVPGGHRDEWASSLPHHKPLEWLRGPMAILGPRAIAAASGNTGPPRSASRPQRLSNRPRFMRPHGERPNRVPHGGVQRPRIFLGSGTLSLIHRTENVGGAGGGMKHPLTRTFRLGDPRVRLVAGA